MEPTNTEADLVAETFGLVVERLPWGGRRVSDPFVGLYGDRRRERVLREGLDEADRHVLAASGVDAAQLDDYRDAATADERVAAFTPGNARRIRSRLVIEGGRLARDFADARAARAQDQIYGGLDAAEYFAMTGHW
jgi:hypothetical protein